MIDEREREGVVVVRPLFIRKKINILKGMRRK